jgi:hypothetical protein
MLANLILWDYRAGCNFQGQEFAVIVCICSITEKLSGTIVFIGYLSAKVEFSHTKKYNGRCTTSCNQRRRGICKSLALSCRIRKR